MRKIKNYLDSELVGNSEKELNQLFDTLADWNSYLEQECADVYNEDELTPEP